MATKIWVEPGPLAALFGVRKKEPGRFALHGVMVRATAGRVSAEATDGRVLVRAAWDDPSEVRAEGPDISVILPAEAMAALKTAARGQPRSADGKASVCLCAPEDGGTAWTLMAPLAGFTATFRAIQGSWPDMDGTGTVPALAPHDGAGAARAYLNPLLLGAMMDAVVGAAGIGPKSGHKSVRVQLGDGKKPIRADFRHRGVSVTGLLMPIDAKTSGFPGEPTEEDRAD